MDHEMHEVQISRGECGFWFVDCIDCTYRDPVRFYSERAAEKVAIAHAMCPVAAEEMANEGG